MKTLILILLLCVSLNAKTTVFKVYGMVSQMCEYSLKAKLTKVKGITKVEIDRRTHTLRVTQNRHISYFKLKRLITKDGLRVKFVGDLY